MEIGDSERKSRPAHSWNLGAGLGYTADPHVPNTANVMVDKGGDAHESEKSRDRRLMPRPRG